jgi:multidrug efflux pump subunit AcrA (membrane-fusion protein)
MSFLERFRRFNFSNTRSRIVKSKRYRRAVVFIERKPFTSFFATLGIFLLILILGSVITNLNKKEVKKTTPVKEVSIYTIGKTPTVPLQAQIQKNGVVQIVAQGSGIVDKIFVSEGDTVKEGQTLVSLSTNYQGGSAPALQAQLAGAQLKNINDTYGLQKDIISKQRDVATASAENTEQLRQVTVKSLNDTRGLLDANRSALNEITTQIEQIEQTNPNDSRLPDLKARQATLAPAVAQLQSTYNSLDYQTNTNNPPTLLSNTQKDLALKQLDVQEKALDLNKRVSGIQYSLALVQEGLMRPASPFTGTVQRVNVQVGENVSSGDVIATIASSSISTTAILRVPQQIAESISRVEPTIFYIKDKKVSVVPSYVSVVATDGQLYSIIYNLPEGVTGLTSNEYIKAEVPVGYAATNGTDPYVPIDSVYESQNEATVYLLKNSKATAQEVTIGEVYGDYVSVLSGLHDGDQLILNRNVVAGDTVKTDK